MANTNSLDSSFTDGVGLSALLNKAKSCAEPAAIGPLLDLFRNYLKLIAQTQISPKLKIRVDPSDIVQETFLDAHRDFAGFKGETEAELIAWLRKILVRNICDQAKRHGAQRRDMRREQSLEAAINQSSIRLAQAFGDDMATPSKQAIRREQAVLVADAIAQLPEIQQKVITMRQIHRVPFDEIGAKLDKSSAAVRMIWLRSLESLKKKIDDYG